MWIKLKGGPGSGFTSEAGHCGIAGQQGGSQQCDYAVYDSDSIREANPGYTVVPLYERPKPASGKFKYMGSATSWDEDFVTDRDAVNDYTGNGYYAINADLRGGRPLEGRAQKVADVLDSLMEDTLPEDTVLFRGVRSANFARDVKVGDTITDHGFVSTTSNFSEAHYMFRKGSDHLIEILMPKTAKCLVVLGEECEVILPRGSKFRVVRTRTVKVTDKPKTSMSEGTYNTINVVTLELLS